LCGGRRHTFAHHGPAQWTDPVDEIKTHASDALYRQEITQ
jgi:hypothetical protein